jgi:beta-lactamase class A
MDLTSVLAPVRSLFGGTRMSVALHDTQSDKWAVYGGNTFDTASIVKVDVLATLLLQAQDAGRTLTAQERHLATNMIENSDNDSASTLWARIGNAAGLGRANKRLGLTQTKGGQRHCVGHHPDHGTGSGPPAGGGLQRHVASQR